MLDEILQEINIFSVVNFYHWRSMMHNIKGLEITIDLDDKKFSME